MLNLGLEGMMIIGASTGFAIAYATNSTLVGVVGAALCGAALAGVFAFLVVGLAANQVAAGLAITIVGRGLANLIGSGFVGLKRARAWELRIPGLSDLPVVGKLLFGQDFFVYGAILLTAGVAYWLTRTRAGLTLRAVGENHTSGHALGLPVRAIRLGAILFGGACAGVAGSYLSLAYTPFWSPDMTAGRGWIALALVVFSSWRPWRGARRRAAVRRRGGAGARLPGARRADPRPGAQRRAIPRHHSRSGVALGARRARGGRAAIVGGRVHPRPLSGRTAGLAVRLAG